MLTKPPYKYGFDTDLRTWRNNPTCGECLDMDLRKEHDLTSSKLPHRGFRLAELKRGHNLVSNKPPCRGNLNLRKGCNVALASHLTERI